MIERLHLPAGDADIRDLARLLVDAVESGAAVSFLAPLPLERAEAWWRRTLSASDPRAIFLVARDTEGIAGTVQLHPAWAPNQPHRAEIAKLLVHRRTRRAGLGTQLMRTVEDAARAAGFTLLTLDAKRGEAAERLYRRLGWTHAGTIPRYALDTDGRTPHDAVIFYKELTGGMERSNGWEAVAREFAEHRAKSTIGVATVRAWAQSIPKGGSILDLGCGSGVPISEALMDEGLAVYGVEAAPSLAAAFRSRFPTAPIACEAAEESALFGRTFDGALAWGLMFLLPADTQRHVIHRVARALNSGGRFLFTAPAQAFTWPDISTGRTSVSLGADAYKAVIAEAGLVLLSEYDDEGDNHYFDAARPATGRV